jgi:hypothetical protein
MTALSKDRDPRRKEGLLGQNPAYQAVKIYGGALVMLNATGYIIPGADTASCIFAGVATKQVDNSSGSSGDKTAEYWRNGLFLMTLDTAITRANVGDQVYLVDDQTVDLVANVTNNIFCGVIAEYMDTTHAWIDIQPATQQADVATHIADASGAHAASAVSIADAGGYTAATELETFTQELGKKSSTVIADPGDGGAIPVTKSGTCALTTTGVDDTRTLAIPTFAGQVLDISLDVDAGDAVITVAAAVNQTGNNTLTGADAGDHIRLVGVQVAGALVWRVAANDGWALSTV